MGRLWGFATIAIVWIGGVANADPRVEANRTVDAKHDCSNAVDFGGCSDPARAEAVAAVAARLTFDRGRAKLTAGSRTALDPLVDALRVHTTLRLRIVGHYATRAGAQADVARRRALMVKWHIIDEGIAADRIDTSVSASKEPGKAIELLLDTLDGATAPNVGRSARDASELASTLTADAVSRPAGGPRYSGANLDQLIEDARKQPVTIGAADGPGFRDLRSSSVGTERSLDLVTVQPMLPISEPKRGENDLGRTSGALHADGARPPAPAVVRMIYARYTRGLDRCYRKSLGGDVTLSGRVRISFGIDIAGKVVDPAVDRVDRDLDGCFRDQMRGWRLPVPLARRDAPRTDARFSITFVFQAN